MGRVRVASLRQAEDNPEELYWHEPPYEDRANTVGEFLENFCRLHPPPVRVSESEVSVRDRRGDVFYYWVECWGGVYAVANYMMVWVEESADATL